MGSEDEETQPSSEAQEPFWNPTSVKQDARQEVAANSWIWRTKNFCKRCFSQAKGVKLETSHHGKFPPEQCPSDWIGYKKKCYFISGEEKDWTSSQTFCTQNRSLLAVFENQEEVYSLAKHLKIDDSWIGLRKKGEVFYWENGIALEVNLFQIRNHSECAYLDDFIISTSACSLPRRWICVQIPKR
ncbi:C-type lectin domain family 2 member B-like isoform X2 [Colius striatus]|uniref:C-type lectin domain family 2 member B-like isoform X2 n=1 Tax=Colius striatus TaxID=57412 RepID=UPI002B1D748C|nr:C-type lectin domain family 2 member B-like isoform X2 [Colius striatus]